MVADGSGGVLLPTGGITPRNSKLLSDRDIDYAPFRCCGDEDLVFLRCEHCGHIWVECYECSTWYVDLNDLSKRELSFLSDEDERMSCPACRKPFADFYYLMDPYVDRYLATADQVVAAGFGRFLASHLRNQDGSP
jgi:hypothetical protein